MFFNTLYFIIENFELVSILMGIFFLINAMLFFIAGYGFLKLKNCIGQGTLRVKCVFMDYLKAD